MTAEKRRLARAPMDTSVLFTIDGRQWRETRSKDISPTGIFLVSNEPVEPGQVIGVTFQLPNLKHTDPIKAKAEVMRRMTRNGRQSGFGLRFLRLTVNQYQLVADFISRVIGVSLSDGFRHNDHPADQDASIFTMDRLAREAEKTQIVKKQMDVSIQSSSDMDIGSWIHRVLGLAAIAGSIFGIYYITTRFLDLLSEFTRLL